MEKSIQNGKIGSKNLNIAGLEISQKHIFYPLNIVNFEQGKYSKLLPEFCATAVFAVQL